MRVLIILLFALLFSVNAKAEWIKVAESNYGQTFYVDINTMYEREGRVFFWELIDYKNKDEYGDHSAKIYIEGDCANYRFKWLKLSYHKYPMAEDKVANQIPSETLKNWQYPEMNSTSMKVLNYVCKNKGVTL